MKVDTACRKLVAEFRSRPTLRAGSLITTVFGDAIAPRGGSVWLGSLITAMQAFDINERLVRTSVFRLAQDNWLQSEQIGRRSYYSLTEEGGERFEQATHRIYGRPAVDWDGNWCLLLLSALSTDEKELARREFGWQGFGQLSANVLAHPVPDLNDLDVTVRRLDVGDRLVVLHAQSLRNERGMQRLAQSSWNIAELDARYRDFVRMFRPVLRAVESDTQASDIAAFTLRTLLIQEYRKVLLRDPQLPPELLPPNWHGVAAYQLCRNLYLMLHRAADRYLTETLETADGPLPPPSGAFWRRFDGLARQRRAG